MKIKSENLIKIKDFNVVFRFYSEQFTVFQT